MAGWGLFPAQRPYPPAAGRREEPSSCVKSTFMASSLATPFRTLNRVTTFERREVPHEVYLRVLDDALGAARSAGIPFALIGGIASTALGRHRYGQDIDIFVEAGDARTLLEALAKAGFAT